MSEPLKNEWEILVEIGQRNERGIFCYDAKEKATILAQWQEEIRETADKRCIGIINQARHSGAIDLRSIIARIKDSDWQWEEKTDE